MARRQLLDTRSEAKLADFDGKRDKFEQWAFMFESYAHLLGWGQIVESAIREQNPIQHSQISADAQAVNGDTLRLRGVDLVCLPSHRCPCPGQIFPARPRGRPQAELAHRSPG